MKINKLIAKIFAFIIVSFALLHSSPELSLRTHLFFRGYISESLTTDIIDDTFHNDVDNEMLKKEKAKCYTLTKPPIHKDTLSELRNYKVTRKGKLYISEYYGEG